MPRKPAIRALRGCGQPRGEDEKFSRKDAHEGGAGLRRRANMKALLTIFALASMVTTAAAQAQTPPSTYAVSTQAKIEYAQHDGVTLTGDLYLPKGLDKAPLVIAVHGGGWQAGAPITYRHWGTFLAKNGFAVFAVSYRLSKPGAKTFPGAVYDVKAAVQFARANVKAVVGFYGVYDMQAQWLHDQITRPRDQITEKFLGVSPMQNRRTYFDASPTSYATVEKNEKTRMRFLLIYGTDDDIVDPQTQSQVFLTALKQAGFFARSIVVPGSGHFWASEPVEEAGSYGAQAAPQMLRFLRAAL